MTYDWRAWLQEPDFFKLPTNRFPRATYIHLVLPTRGLIHLRITNTLTHSLTCQTDQNMGIWVPVIPRDASHSPITKKPLKEELTPFGFGQFLTAGVFCPLPLIFFLAYRLPGTQLFSISYFLSCRKARQYDSHLIFTDYWQSPLLLILPKDRDMAGWGILNNFQLTWDQTWVEIGEAFMSCDFLNQTPKLWHKPTVHVLEKWACESLDDLVVVGHILLRSWLEPLSQLASILPLEPELCKWDLRKLVH